MKRIQKKTAGRQMVVFDRVDATLPTGVVVDTTDAQARFTEGILPAGTLLVKGDDGRAKVLNEDLSQTNVTREKALGLTMSDIEIDDYPQVSVVVAGTVRKEALPDKEKAGLTHLMNALPRLTFY